MNFINQNKLLSHANFDGKPITADIFLTNFCNNKCPYCTYGRWELISNEKKKYITFEEFEKYGNRLLELGVKGFVLSGGGEPTINPDFDKITKIAGMNITIVTSAKTDAEAKSLLTKFNMPFRK